MKQRVITAVIALAIFIPIIVAGGFWIELAAAVLSVIAIHEFYRMKYQNEVRIWEELLAILATLSLVLPIENWLSFIPDAFILYYFFVLILMAMTVFDKKDFTIEALGFPVFISLYVGFGFDCFVTARFNSLIVLLLALIIVWSTDIGAYMIGRKFGRHKLAPSVSPNKTIEGAVGGVVSAVVVTFIYMMFYKDSFPYSMGIMLILSIFFSVAGQLGDLVESAYKRYFGVKDSGKLLPGHGGILDRFDSLLFVFPVMYFVGLFTM